MDDLANGEVPVHLAFSRKQLADRIAELEAENRIFRNTESVDDSVWDALLEQIRHLRDQQKELLDALKHIGAIVDKIRYAGCEEAQATYTSDLLAMFDPESGQLLGDEDE